MNSDSSPGSWKSTCAARKVSDAKQSSPFCAFAAAAIASSVPPRH
jgi:hypothetical protein